MLLKDYAKCQSANISLNLKNFILGQFWPLLVHKPQKKIFHKNHLPYFSAYKTDKPTFLLPQSRNRG